MKTKYAAIIIISVLAVLTSSAVFAQNGGTTLDDVIAASDSESLDLASRTLNLYNTALGFGAILALGVIVYGGVRYSASAGNPSGITEAKKWIIAGLLGLLLLFGSFLTPTPRL